jgi:hypothetical protein
LLEAAPVAGAVELEHGVDRFGAIAAGEQAVVADAVEALGEDVDEETANELIDVERHRGVSARSLDPPDAYHSASAHLHVCTHESPA